MAKVFLNGQPVEHPHEVHEHISPMSTYNGVIGALFVLTGLTFAVSFADLGPASLTVAMVVAFIKATLVVAYFMHLKYDDKFHLFVFLGTIIFVGIFFGFTMFDMKSRDALNDEQETFVRWKEQENAGKGLVVGVDNVPERRAKVLAEIEAHGGGHGGGEHGGGHSGGEHKAEAKAEHKAAAH
ncbi:cytochrome C oxidase subunit IV family protein [Nannocystis sp. ILAH1]|uniref:cytochrome C oxidase subunit IV family protein n=1 Tax=Nannocystis sp. ILAH1 TaxID=2996789 RepID=UPI00226F749D|nr:cytochrome C oxidase subunit IV family protein [Nannocystis sp. ILAH1]MCY0993654.1 cytochrome C oxidase subunit IV family protein [Nannocystis sp. ILAH1]